jgi:serine/threonine protein kinase
MKLFGTLERSAMQLPAPDSSAWKRLAPYFDRALDLAPRERETWLAELTTTEPDIAQSVREMLRERDLLNAQGFLTQSPLESVTSRNGLLIGPYTIDRLLGRGGMGEVWLAKRSDGRFEGACAVKFLEVAQASPKLAERFRREGQVLARLTHPNIARLLDAGATEDGAPYLALEYVDGQRIDAYCERKQLSIVDRVRLFVDVIAAVAHAHSHLVIHRDLKPSNVLVSHDGHVKLLDFGIAKLLSNEIANDDNLTRVEEVVLTPEYAAPEQMLGELPSTATDVYQLGMLLYVLLTGRHPLHIAGTRAERMRAALEGVVPQASTLVDKSIRKHLQGDLDAILAKALRKLPSERYATAQALHEDIRCYLSSEPVHARRGATLYRARKFVSRHRIGVAAAFAIVASLSVGVYVASRERDLAQRRFDQVRQLSNRLFDIDVAIRDIPGTVAARQLIVDTSLEYLGRLAGDAGNDPDLALDLGAAYMRVARVQGVPISANLGQTEKADRTLQTASTLVDAVLMAQPNNRTAFFRKAQIAHDRMILAGLRRPDDDAITFARESTQWLDRYLEAGAAESIEARQVVVALINVGNRFRIEEQFDEALRLTDRAQVIAATAPDLQEQLGGAQIGLGRIHRDRGALAEAVGAQRAATRTFEGVNRAKATPVNNRRLALALIEQAETLGFEGGLSLGRTTEAVALFRRAFQMVDEVAHLDARDAESRGLVSSAGRPLAMLLRHTDIAESLAIHDHVLRHLSEIQGNARFRRDEVRALVASATLLQQMGRTQEARNRLDKAFVKLRDLKLYPQERIEIGSEPQDALLALAEFQISTGESQHGRQTCDELLDAVLAAGPKPETNLLDAAEVSYLYESVGRLLVRAGMTKRAEELTGRRAQLWRRWAQRLPDNPFVLAQIAGLPR